MIIGFVLFLILILALIIYESSQRYTYVEETRKVWAAGPIYRDIYERLL